MFKVISVLLLSISAFCAVIEGEGKFLASDGDSVPFVKRQLLSEAYKDVISKELVKMGLDTETFWANYNVKFEEHFTTIKEALDKKYDLENKPEAEKSESYIRSLRYKRLVAKRKFGRLSRVIKSYSVKKTSKSLRLPNSHYMNISARINRKRLTNIYYKFIGAGKYRSLRKLYVDVSYKLKNVDWLEFGVDTKKDLIDVVNGHWKEKLKTNVGTVFSEGIEFIDEGLSSDINNHLKQLNRSQMMPSASSQLTDSLVLKLEVEISKEVKDEVQNKLHLKFNGGMILTDLKNGNVVSFLDFIKETSGFETRDQHALSSSIASLIYRLPMSKIQSLRKDIEENLRTSDSIEILVRGSKNIDQLLSFTDHLKEKGILYYFSPGIQSL